MNSKGKIWPQDQWNRILNAALNADELNPHIWNMANNVINTVKRKFGAELHGIYLSGQAARGRYGQTNFIILLNSQQHISQTWKILAEQQTIQRWPDFSPLSFYILNRNSLFKSQFHNTRFQLSVNSTCLYGPDLSRLMPPPKIDNSTGNAEILLFGPRMARAAAYIAGNSSYWKNAACNAGYAALSAAFSMIMEQEQSYSQDADIQSDLFCLHEPARRRDMQIACRLSSNNSHNQNYAMKYIEHTCKWLTPMTEAWLNAHNPQRLQFLHTP